jgi:drug/metabolite transporter (DMT)-like permease
MVTLANDTAPVVRTPRALSGLAFAVLSATSFGLSGALARGLLDTGWTPGAVSLLRIAIAAVVVLPFGLVSMRGRWHLLRLHLRTVAVYGVVAVALPQFSYFSAVAHMPVAPALLIEFTAPAAVVVFLWLRRGERPGRVTVAGAAIAALGLLLVLDVMSGAALSPVGVAWAMMAMLGCATYFLMSGDDTNSLPPIALASGGMLVAAVALALLGLSGLLDMHAETLAVDLAGAQVDWWVPIVLLGVVTAAISYVAGIAAVRRLGSRLASFVALLEVVSGVLWAWFLLDELPHAVQLLGGVLILAGVVGVKLGERTTGTSTGTSTGRPDA